MANANPKGYSAQQIGLHWTVAALIVMQFLAHYGIEHVWDAFEDGRTIDGGDMPLAYLHIATGLTIFVLALWRLWLRYSRGAPALPENEPQILKVVARATHFLIYALIVGMPVSGAVAWFLGVGQAAGAHVAAKNLLFVLVVLHVAGALFQHFMIKSDVLSRIVMTKD